MQRHGKMKYELKNGGGNVAKASGIDGIGEIEISGGSGVNIQQLIGVLVMAWHG